MAEPRRRKSQPDPRPQESVEQRSEALLRELLSREQYTLLQQRRYLDIPSPNHPDRTYRIPRAGMVQVIEQGQVVEYLCITPIEPLPPNDVIAVHKLLIEADEATYLSTANHFTPPKDPFEGTDPLHPEERSFTHQVVREREFLRLSDEELAMYLLPSVS